MFRTGGSKHSECLERPALNIPDVQKTPIHAKIQNANPGTNLKRQSRQNSKTQPQTKIAGGAIYSACFYQPHKSSEPSFAHVFPLSSLLAGHTPHTAHTHSTRAQQPETRRDTQGHRHAYRRSRPGGRVSAPSSRSEGCFRTPPHGSPRAAEYTANGVETLVNACFEGVVLNIRNV